MERRQLYAGMAAGALSTLICHPIDLIKVRIQMDTRHDYRSRAFMYTLRTIKEMYARDGLRSLYRGLSANLLGSMSSWGLYFLFYEYLKNESGKSVMVSAALAGATTQLITNPIWLAKSRLCALPSDADSYSGLVDCLNKVYKQQGFRGLYRGLLPGLAGVSHGAIQFSIYEEAKTRLRPYFSNDFVLFSLCGGMSKIGAILSTYPFQVVRTRVQVSNHTNVVRLISSFIKMEEGVLGMYKGIGPTILRVLPSSCITLVTYELVVKAL
jgi:solute carrier family 25 folate transporter 32